MDTIRICKQCRKPLPENAPEGLCPECLAKVALGSEPAAPGRRVAPDVAQLAAQFPQLEILELLGMGGMGMVYKARQPRLDRIVALKILPVESAQHPSFAERFSREAKALAKLNHPGIVDIYDFGQSGQYYYFVMEFVDGMNLRQLLNAGTVAPRQALELVIQICTALQYAHEEGVVHRDIKPENILINKKGQVKIADFGLAKLLGGTPDTALTMSQAAMGTLNYMAPEQRENAQKVDHRADIYSLGVVFYEMLTGEVPMGRFDPPSKKVQVDVRLDEVVLRALEREPARRYQQVSEVKTGVETITSTMPREKSPAGATEAFKPQRPPGFVSYVLKRFAIFVLAWLGAGLCLRWAVGDTSLSVGFGQHQSLSVQLTTGAFIFALGGLDLGMAKIFLPAGFVLVVYAWLEARERRGLSFRQLPPPIRRRFQLWIAVIGGAFVVLVLAPLWAPSGVIPMRYEQTREWWFVPTSGGYEKLGLRATFTSFQQDGKVLYEAPSNCNVSLLVYRKDKDPSVMKVTLPGLRAEYRIPPTNPWPNSSVLEKDTLVQWLQKGAGLDTTTPKFQGQASEIYALLKQYENAPPHTGDEFMNVAKADLSDFWFGGFTENGTFSAMGVGGSSMMRDIFWVLGGEGVLYLAFALWATRRLYRAAWIEIAAGRWIPPKSAPPFPAAIKVLFALLFLSLACAVVAGLEGERNPQYSMLVAYVSLGIILIVALQRHSRQQIQQARERGLWPQLGELPTIEHVKGLAQAGEMILAIKLYRQIHPVSLLDAKAAVEKLAR